MNSSPGLLALIFITGLTLAGPLHAQTTKPSAEQLKAWIATRQQRVDLLRVEIKQTDERIESRLDIIIDTLTTIADSKDSRTKVARMKEDTMKRLMKTIQYYDQKRSAIREEIRNPKTRLTEAEKKQIISAFDVRIEKRTQQILELNKSMPNAKEYERYKATGGGWDGTDFERNRDFEQNRRMTSHTNSQRDALVKQLDSSLARLDRHGRELRSQLAAATQPALQEDRKAEIAKNDALIAERRQQKQELAAPSDKAQRGVELKEAMDLDSALKKAAGELNRDFTTLFARYNSLLAELSALHANEAMLKEMSAR